MFGSGIGLYPQDDQPVTGGEGIVPDKQESESGGDIKESKEEGALSLFEQTLADDINTATYYDLVSWCEQIGIDKSGDVRAIRDRIFKFYNIDPNSVKSGEKAPKRKIEISSAKKSDYFTIGEINESYLVLEGNVVVEVIDLEKNVRHHIKAQRITLNQTQNVLTAEQDIEYILTRSEGTPEVFKGESFSFNINSWEGVFYRGGGRTEREIEEGKTSTFVFMGDAISRLSDDTIILDNGVITSDKSPDNPYWKITATKIWVLAPGEWAIFNAVFHVGSVPIFYIPFFFYPGDELFFHPVIGYREREGTFLQTTTYLVGEKEKKKSPFSFLRVTEEDAKKYKKEIKGLFLRQVKGDEAAKAETVSGFLKLMIDVYLRLGGFVGIEGEIPQKLKIKGGVAASRSLFYDVYGGFYTPHYDGDGDDELEDYWNSTNLFGMKIPLRYALETSFSGVKLGFLSTSGLIELFSDPYFEKDFYERKEDFDITSLIGMGEIEDTTLILPDLKQNLTWSITSEIDFSSLMPKPYINELKISRMNVNFNWNNKNAENWYGDNVLYAADPARTFFYPIKLFAPDVKANISGTLLSFGSSGAAKKQEKASEADPGKGFRPPFHGEKEHAIPEEQGTAGEAGGQTETVKRGELHEPAIKGFTEKDTGVTLETGSEFSLDYSVTPEFKMETQYDAADWQKVDDIDFGTWLTLLQTGGPASLYYSAKYFGKLFTINGSLALNGWYKTRFNRSPDYPETTWENELTNDYNGSYVSLTKSLNTTIKPLYTIRDFTNSYINYRLTWMFYKYRFDELDGSVPIYTSDWFLWEREQVTSHSLNNMIEYDPGFLDLKAICNISRLPPLLMEIQPSMSLAFWILTTTVGTKMYEKEKNNWYFDTVTITETVNLSPAFILSESLTYDTEESAWMDSKTALSLFLIPGTSMYLLNQNVDYSLFHQKVTSSTSTLQFPGFTAIFAAQEMLPFRYDSKYEQLVEDNGTTKRLLPNKLTVSYNTGLLNWDFWQKRMKVSSSLETSLNIFFEEFTASNFNITCTLNWNIAEFLELTFSVSSYNDSIFLYIPGFIDRLPDGLVEPVDFFDDLFKSFNFFNEEDRIFSNFNLKTLNLSLVHHLYDWDLTLNFNGSFKEIVTGKKEWYPTVSIFVEWIPIPEIKKEMKGEGDTFNIIGG